MEWDAVWALRPMQGKEVTRTNQPWPHARERGNANEPTLHTRSSCVMPSMLLPSHHPTPPNPHQPARKQEPDPAYLPTNQQENNDRGMCIFTISIDPSTHSTAHLYARNHAGARTQRHNKHKWSRPRTRSHMGTHVTRTRLHTHGPGSRGRGSWRCASRSRTGS